MFFLIEAKTFLAMKHLAVKKFEIQTLRESSASGLAALQASLSLCCQQDDVNSSAGVSLFGSTTLQINAGEVRQVAERKFAEFLGIFLEAPKAHFQRALVENKILVKF